MRPDDELGEIRAAAAGNRLAQSALVTRHMPRLYALSHRMLGDAQLAEDVVQETFLRAWKVLGRWESKARLSTWLHRVALNLCYDHLRKRRESLPGELPERADTGPQPDEALARSQRMAALDTAIASLPERQRAALTLCALDGHSNIEAAAIMQISVEALESLLARARRTLKTRMNMEDHGGAGGPHR